MSRHFNQNTQGAALAGRYYARDGAVPFYERISISTASSSEIDTSFDLPQECLVVDAFLHVKTAAAATTLDVGLFSSSSGGDADGFLDGLDVSSTGIVQAAVTVSTSDGVFYSANTYGVLLSNFNAGTTSASAGLFTRKSHASDSVTAKSVTVTANSTVALSADLYLGLVDLDTSS